MLEKPKAVRLNRDMANALGRLAEDEGQPEGVVIRQALIKYLRERGYIKPVSKKLQAAPV